MKLVHKPKKCRNEIVLMLMFVECESNCSIMAECCHLVIEYLLVLYDWLSVTISTESLGHSDLHLAYNINLVLLWRQLPCLRIPFLFVAIVCNNSSILQYFVPRVICYALAEINMLLMHIPRRTCILKCPCNLS